MQINNLFFYILYIILNPRLVWLYIAKKIYIPVYLQFEWLKDYQIGTIVDVGAYHGLVFRSLMTMFPKAKAFAFEPNTENFEFLKNNYKRVNITLEKLAMGDKETQVSFFEHGRSYLSSLYEPGTDFEKISSLKDKRAKTEVVMSTLDSYFRNIETSGNILLKIDTQGSEGLVLSGAKDFLKRVMVIHLEIPFANVYQDNKTFDWIYKYLTSFGFKYVGEVRESDFYPRFNLPISANSVFVKTIVIPRLKKGTSLTKK